MAGWLGIAALELAADADVDLAGTSSALLDAFVAMPTSWSW
jgi:hypothetical protein